MLWRPQNQRDEALEHDRVRAGTVCNVQIGKAGRLRHARVDDDQHPIGILRRVADHGAGVEKLMRDESVGAPEHQDLAVLLIRLRKADLVAEDLAVAPPVAEKLKADGVEQVLTAEAVDERLDKQILALTAAGGTADAAHGAGAVLIHNRAQLVADLQRGLIPADALKVVAHLFHRIVQPVVVVQQVFAASPLAAGIAVGAGAVLVRTAACDLAVLDLHLQAATHRADGALCFFPFAHGASPPREVFRDILSIFYVSDKLKK